MNLLNSFTSLLVGKASSDIRSFGEVPMEQLITMPNYSYTFKFEKEFAHKEIKLWFDRHWTMSFYYVGIYLLMIFLGRLWMAKRPRLELRGPLICWNVMLALFSLFGTLRTVPELVHVVRHHGLYHSICVPSFGVDQVAAFWATMFVLSKVPELGDTVFIILRKQPLIFLHYYHHATVLVYAWYGSKEHTGTARWFMTMNFAVHSVMYSYFALRAMKYKLPNWVPMVVTSLQLIQMVMAVVINLLVYQLLQNGKACHVTELNVKLSFLMYFSYLVLFANFFYKAYIDKQSLKKLVVSDGGSTPTVTASAKKLK